ncbi:MAG: ECF transporter S component [Oscillospiraceae bacterium]|nr:ECF transporter S component [Oscillospiraceae bacterium]
MRKTKKLVFAGLCTALGVALPIAFHAIPNAGGIFLPMHIPVLLCGLLCGPAYGLACGVLAPLLSAALTGMPPAAVLPSMLCELAVYGLVSGLLAGCVHTKSSAADVYIALLGAMLAGRAVSGALNALLFRAGAYSLQTWLAASFVTALPGIAAQLLLIPALVFALRKARL